MKILSVEVSEKNNKFIDFLSLLAGGFWAFFYFTLNLKPGNAV